MTKPIVFFSVLTGAVTAFPAERPNIVIVLADDLGYGDISKFNPESKINTPRIDALATEGVWCTDAHSPSSICSPTRYALLTGRYAWRGSLRTGIVLPWETPAIERDRQTIAGMLKTAGYETACIGKWHLGMDWPWKDGKRPSVEKLGKGTSKATMSMFDFSKPITGGPWGAGFDYYFGDDIPNFPPYAFIENGKLLCDPVDTDPAKFKSIGVRGYLHGTGPGDPDWELNRVMPTITAKAVDFIEQRKDNETPFFLFFATTSPHTPVVPAEEFIGTSAAGFYGDYVVQTDAAAGAVIDALKRTGQFENTLFIFTSDNGPSHLIIDLIQTHNHSPAGSWRGIKQDSWEGGHRVPFVASWPAGGISGGRKVEVLISLVDLFATTAELTGGVISAGAAEDSVNILPALRAGETVRTETVYHAASGELALRQNEWVYCRKTGGAAKAPEWYKQWINAPERNTELPGELFNLKTDPKQLKNLYEIFPERAADMEARLDEIEKKR